MPELPEVETVRRGIDPVLSGARVKAVRLYRPDIRYPIPKDLPSRLEGAVIRSTERRGKYILIETDRADTLIIHLGMSGAIKLVQADEDYTIKKHDHIEVIMENGQRMIYHDPRRFGFWDIVSSDKAETCRHFIKMGPEPLGNHFYADYLYHALRGKKTPIKIALLDQRIVAGLGNIYVCEALYQSGIHPNRAAGRISRDRLEVLVPHIRDVLLRAIDSGGSTLRDYTKTDGSLGYFQHAFKVYDREGEMCQNCHQKDIVIKRIVQSGRSSFFCAHCQR